MIVLPAVLKHLESTLRGTFRQYGSVEKAAGLVTDFRRSPACFVLPLRTRPHGRPVDGGTRHARAEEQFGVGLVLKATDKARVRDLHRQVYSALQGARLKGTQRPIEWTGGQLLQAGDNLIVWQLTFETLTDMENTP